uniref:FH2 domain-containing protein n=1 Tax=Acrobeloides nanus TaxID=290746 RepID=A0A914CV06_9BILA
MEEDFLRTTIHGILENPQKNFPRFLFESDVIATIDLLNELVIVPKDGHRTVVECLLCWQDLMEHSYGLEPVVSELIHADEPSTAIACMKLINNLINLSPNAIAKIRIRHELNELQFDDRLLALREKFSDNIELYKELENWHSLASNSFSLEEVSCRTDADSGTFSDEEDEMAPNPPSTDYNSNPDPKLEQEFTLRSVIDKFLEIFNCGIPKEDRNLIIDTFVELLKQLALRLGSNGLSGPLPLVLGSIKTSFDSAACSTRTSTFKPPAAPPPPPPSFLLKTPTSKPGPPSAPPPPPSLKTPTAPPPPLKSNGATPCAMKSTSACSVTPMVSIPNSLKPKAVPPVGKKFKLLQWTKIPEMAIVGENNELNIWQRMENIDLDTSFHLDFSKLDDYFASHIYDNTPTTKNSISKKGTTKKIETVSLLSSKRSMNIGIFLKQFKDIDNLLESITDGRNDLIDLERLKLLTTLLPDSEECATLRGYTGDINLLGQAECFLLKLLSINDYKIRIEAMLLREEFGCLIKNVTPQLETIISAGKELKSSQSLQKILLVLLHMGNYLNHGANTGNAVGFKLNSLWMIADLRATKGGGITLLHLIGQQLSTTVEVLKNELIHVKEAAGLTLETIRSDITNIDKRINTLENQLRNKEGQFSLDTMQFIKEAKNGLTTTFEQIQELELLRKDLAIYFCENEKTFRLEECFKIFNTFLTRFYAAIQENQERELREGRKRAKKLRSSSSQSLNSSIDSTTNFNSLNSNATSNGHRRSARLESNQNIENLRLSQNNHPYFNLRAKNEAHKTASLSRVRPKEPIFDQNILDNDHLEAFVDKELSMLLDYKKPVGTRPSILQSELWKKLPEQKPKEFEKISVHVSSDSSAYSSDSSPTNRRSENETSESDYSITTSTSNPSPKQNVSHVKVVYTSEITPIKPIESRSKSPDSVTNLLVNVPISYEEKSPRDSKQKASTTTVARRSTLRSVRTQQSNACEAITPPTQHHSLKSPSLVKAAQKISMAASMGKVRAMSDKIAKDVEVNGTTTPLSRKSSDSDSKQSSPKTISPPKTAATQNNRLALRNLPNQRLVTSSAALPARPPLAKTLQASLKEPARRSVPMSAVEKRRTMMTKTESVSTASRPSLIKTGSKTSADQKPKWI